MAILCANISESVHDETSNISEMHELPFARLMTLFAEVVGSDPLAFEVPQMRKSDHPKESHCIVQ
jgi:hypothetical protein